MSLVVETGLAWAIILAVATVLSVPVWWLWFRAPGGASVPPTGASVAQAGASVAPAGAAGEVAACGLPRGPGSPRDLGTGTLLAISAVLVLGNHLVLRAPRVGAFAELGWNWQGKLLATVASLLLVASWSRLRWRDVGLAMPRPGAWRPVVTLSAAAVGIYLVLGIDAEIRGSYLETLLFQATMPGIEEELFYRGILWVLIDRALPRKRVLFGARVGMGFVVSTLLFGLAHGVVVTDGEALSLVLAPVIFTGIAGAVFAWVRARTDSILPAIALHNALNVAIHLGG